MSQPSSKIFAKAEKTLACDLKPGDLFVYDLPDDEYYTRELDKFLVALPVFLRTNVDAEDLDDKDTVVYKVIITRTDTPERTSARIDPRVPPGMEDF